MSQVVEAFVRFCRRRDRLRRFVRRRPIFIRVLSKLLPRYRQYAVRPDSDAVIEGYPRSANTFAVVAFKMSQPKPVNIGRHLHSLGHVYRGLQLAKPTLIVIRNPRDSVLSYAIAQPQLRLESLLREYIDFYEGIERLGDDVVLGEFNEVTNDFGAVIRRLNTRFATDFREFDSTPENVARCNELIDEEDRRNDGQDVRPMRVARPSAERTAIKRGLSARLDNGPALELLTAAEGVYSRLLGKHGLSIATSMANDAASLQTAK